MPDKAWAESVVVVITGPEAEEPDAAWRVLVELEEEPENVRILDLQQIREQVRVISLARRSDDAGCGGPVRLEDWLAGLVQAEAFVQLLDFNGALDRVNELELESACLDQVPQRGDLQRLHLVAASAALLASWDASEAVRTSNDERMVQAARAARSLGDDLLLPAGLDPQIEELLETVELPKAVPVAATGPGGRVYVDGVPLARSGARLVPGLRLVQVQGNGGPIEVTAATLYPLARSSLLYAGTLPEDRLAQDLAAVGQGLPASELVRALERLLGLPLLVAHLGPGGVTVWTPEGTRLGETEPEALAIEVSPTAAVREVDPGWVDRFTVGGKGRTRVIGAGVSSAWTTLKDPVAGDLSGLVGGLALWLRVPTSSWVTLAVTLNPVASRAPLPDGYDADWLYRAWIPLRVGLRVEGTLDDRRWEVGVDGLAAWLGSYEEAPRVLPGVAVAGSVTRPVIDQRFALRLELNGVAGIGFAGGGVVAGLDTTF